MDKLLKETILNDIGAVSTSQNYSNASVLLRITIDKQASKQRWKQANKKRKQARKQARKQ